MDLVGSIVTNTSEMIKQQLYQEAVFLFRVRGQFEWIQRELSRMSNFVKDADRKLEKGDESIKGWVEEVRGVAYDADDAITFYVWMEEQWRRRTLIQKCVFFFCDLCTLHKAGVKIEAVKQKISEISSSRSNYGLTEIIGGETPSPSIARLQDYRRIADMGEEKVIGFERDAAVLLADLTTGEPGRCVVSVVAMGGAGKTTLARKLYNCRDVKDHFDGNIAWVCVSQTYSVKELLQEIAEQVMKLSRKDSSELTVKLLKETLSEFLKERKYLIVLDDIWEHEAWDQLRAAFPDGKNGSRIMFTTRYKDVALYADRRSLPHELPLLNAEESWALFLNRVFPEKNGKPNCPHDLEEIGKQMVARCGGLPLAIGVLAGLLSTKDETVNAWLKVLGSLNWQLSQESVHCTDILALSYYELPDYLKPCFLYLGIFPDDYAIPVGKLTSLWIAEGFIQRRGEEIKEDVAEDCLKELVSRSMIQVAEWEYDGRIVRCRVHDLLREFAISEAQRHHLLEIDRSLQDASISALTHVRRLGIHRENEDSLCQSSLPTIRSLLCFTNFFPRPLLGGAKWLRVLDLDGVTHLDEKLADQVFGVLVHLKYLSLLGTGIASLPPSICKLYNLEYLHLARFEPILLPAAIWSMHRLRHLTAARCSFDGRPQLRLLKRLHTLTLEAGDWIEKDSLITLSELRNLEVRGDLQPYDGVLTRAIEQMVNIQTLSLEGSAHLPPFMPFTHHFRLESMFLKGTIPGKLPQSHEFPPSLTKLELFLTRLEQDPLPTLGKLSKLRILILRNNAYKGRKMISSSQGFPQLRFLHFHYLKNLREWIVEKGAMPALKRLQIEVCNQLEMLPEGLRDVTTLQDLLVFMPQKFYQRLGKNEGEDWYKIQHIPSLTISKILI